jgi:fimbrial isopeptide formation D2 family protein/LPXTG-motif cell wall-anchored protein
MKKILALVTAGMMTIGAASIATADVNITINRDSSYAGDEDSSGREFTYYQIFRATYDSNTSTGGGVAKNGAPGAVSSTGDGFSYFLDTEADSTRIAQLASNDYFTLTPSADGTKQIVTWKDGVGETAADVQAAAAWLSDSTNYTPISSGSLTMSENGASWTAGVDEGYYVIAGSEGKNLVAATTDISINEKNSYPTIDKKEKDEDKDEYVDENVNVAVGDIIEYTVDVKIPADANMPIVVTDTMSKGLQYKNDVTSSITSGVAYTTDEEALENITWQATITPNVDNKGKTIVFSFSALVTSDALIDTGKQNEVTLDYNNGHYVMPDKVEHDVYWGGIVKKSETADGEVLEGVKFNLQENGVDFKVSKPEGKDYYIPDENGSSEVVTDANGVIVIRGLDGDKTYALTETEALQGYNLLESKVEITKHLDEITAPDASFSQKTGDLVAGYDIVINNKGALLPSTGGIGTTIFYVIGGILVVLAGIVLVTRRKAAK